MRLPKRSWTIVAAALALLPGAASVPQPPRPNVLVILADDLALSDIAPYGGEIDTPNLQRLARSGVTFTAFHTSPMCSPSRAMLLTGVEAHRTGYGAMAEFVGAAQKGKPGYEGYLNDRVVTLADRLKAAGYRTSIAGKWHLGAQSPPQRRGFDDSIVLMEGASSHFDDTGYAAFKPKATYLRNGAPATLPKDFYSSDFYASEAIRQIGDGRRDRRPFFAYLAFSAPHWPLHAPAETIAKYEGRYEAGWDVLRAARFAALKRRGVIGRDAVMPPRLPQVPAWSTLSPDARRHQARLMTVYAAMVDRLDQNVGRVLDHLERTGQLRNTVIVFASDNGPEAVDFTTNTPFPGATDWIAANFDNSTAALGSRRSYPFYGQPWAQAGAAAHRYYKTYVTEGGLHSPLIVAWPGQVAGGGTARAFANLVDIAPTVLEAAGVGRQRRFSGAEPITGRSLLPYLRGKAATVYPAGTGQGFELFANEAYISGDWKILRLRPPAGDGQWKLYHLASDPGELTDLAARQPARFARLQADYRDYARRNNVILRTEPFELFRGHGDGKGE